MDIAFKFMKSKHIWKTRSRKKVPQAGGAIKETVSIQLMITSNQSTVNGTNIVANLVQRLNSYGLRTIAKCSSEKLP